MLEQIDAIVESRMDMPDRSAVIREPIVEAASAREKRNKRAQRRVRLLHAGGGQFAAGASDYLRMIEANLPKLKERPALIVWGMKDFAFGDAARTAGSAQDLILQ